MEQLSFTLHSECVALGSNDQQRKVITIPVNVRVSLVSGDITGNGVVEVNYHNQSVQMLAVDLRAHGVLDPSSV
jgi:hypothetical protein